MELTAEQCRVLGCLIEKERATPQNYPLTLNALRLACNQSTNREPIVDYDDHTIEAALVSLREQGLTRIVYSTSNRAAKYRHVLGEAWHLGDDDLAALAILLLRGPQTLGEIKGRSERLHAFADLDAVTVPLERMAGRDEPLVVRLERRPGQKDVRWAHLLQGEVVEVESSAAPSTARTAASTGLREDVDALKAEVVALRNDLDSVRAELAAFRAEFS